MKHKVKHLHFVGIGGAGMSGIAEVLLNLGFQVSGSDLSQNVATKRLKKLGATLYLGHAEQNLTNADVVVISTAVKVYLDGQVDEAPAKLLNPTTLFDSVGRWRLE